MSAHTVGGCTDFQPVATPFPPLPPLPPLPPFPPLPPGSSLLPFPPGPGASVPGGPPAGASPLDVFAADIGLVPPPAYDVATGPDGPAPGRAGTGWGDPTGAGGDGGFRPDAADALALLVTALTDLRDGVRALTTAHPAHPTGERPRGTAAGPGATPRRGPDVRVRE